ncbi:glycosyltransferase family 2 protein [Lysobacter sp. Root494]|uniref:glycosyltransferase family 2 protein n=1 Tax=Lysobacter sp. Root494 TaxID=1736549 RepID=UPI0006FA05CB|nr:glycosyltransferase family 2 protein [Lysobacter sp. Root494]KQY49766.1 glycosyl transferase [Lysobacter sp. Root494]
MTHADIAAIVVSYQSAETIDDCLLHLRGAECVGAIRVVDNGSDDGTMEIVQRHATRDPRVHFIANPDNPGFAVACNQGAEDLPHANGTRWLAFVNPDCLVEIRTLAKLRAHAIASGREVLLGADLVDETGERDAAARRRDPDFGAMLASLRRGDTPSGAQLGVPMDDGQALQPVDAVSGALMVMPRELFERLGGFDTGYRLHAEDLDLCRRAREAGALVAVANDVRVVHIRGVSSRSRPLFVEWHKHRGLWRYFGKFEATRRSVFTRCAVFAAIWGRFPFATLRALARK